MSINSSKDLEKWPTGCHNLNHLIWWQFLSTGGSLLMVDLLVFRSSSRHQVCGFFQVSHLLTDPHRMLHGLMWCLQWKNGYWMDIFFATCVLKNIYFLKSEFHGIHLCLVLLLSWKIFLKIISLLGHAMKNKLENNLFFKKTCKEWIWNWQIKK